MLDNFLFYQMIRAGSNISKVFYVRQLSLLSDDIGQMYYISEMITMTPEAIKEVRWQRE